MDNISRKFSCISFLFKPPWEKTGHNFRKYRTFSGRQMWFDVTIRSWNSDFSDGI